MSWAARTAPVPCAACPEPIPETERAFLDEMTGRYEHLACAAERFSCDQCYDRFPESQAIVVPQPFPYQEQRYCSVECVIEAKADEEEPDED